jgi:hypothetical protein
MLKLLEQNILKSGEKKIKITVPALIGAYLNSIQGPEAADIVRKVRDLINGVKEHQPVRAINLLF